MWDKILPDDLLIKVFHFNSPRSPSTSEKQSECFHVFHFHLFSRLLSRRHVFSFIKGDWVQGVPPGQLRQLRGKQLVSQLNQGSTMSILLFINPIVLVSRIQLERNAWIHWSVQRITICFKLIVQRCILIQINVNYIVKYMYICKVHCHANPIANC